LILVSRVLTTILFGIAIACTAIFSLLAVATLSQPSYNRNAQSISLVSIRSFVGILIGFRFAVFLPIRPARDKQSVQAATIIHEAASRW
jgi:hypothetical protein